MSANNTGPKSQSTLRGGDWLDEAACIDEDPELFFPYDSSFMAGERIEQAKKVCRRCKVVEACLLDALDHPDKAWPNQVRGGFTERELDGMRLKK